MRRPGERLAAVGYWVGIYLLIAMMLYHKEIADLGRVWFP